MKFLPVGDCVWEIPPSEKPGMRVPARIYASEALLGQMDKGVFEQVTNVACLPGIVRASLCMPDGPRGYGHLSETQCSEVMVQGSGWCVKHGYGWPEDLEGTEGRGCLPGADPAHVSARAVSRGGDELGSVRA